MANLFSSSIGKKIIMSLSGFFLFSFILVHLTVNLFLLGGQEAYNVAAHFMETNPIISIIEPILGLGFLFHIVYSIILTLSNLRARPIRYKVSKPGSNSTWASRNMFVLGGLILTFLVMHIINFYWKLKFGEVSTVIINGVEMHDTYTLVTSLFINSLLFDIFYIVGAVFLGLHLSHGIWSAFQTIGLDNDIWRPRLTIISILFSIIIAAGFSIIPIYFFISNI